MAYAVRVKNCNFKCLFCLGVFLAVTISPASISVVHCYVYSGTDAHQHLCTSKMEEKALLPGTHPSPQLGTVHRDIILRCWWNNDCSDQACSFNGLNDNCHLLIPKANFLAVHLG